MEILFVETPVVRTGTASSRFPGGSRIVLLQQAQGVPVLLTDGFFAAADPQVNFEATKVLFSAEKKQGDHWQLWEMDVNGANKRQITDCAENCVRGAYLPGNEIALTVEEATGKKAGSYIAVVKADGSQLRRVTFGPANFVLETVLRDGRIVASAPWPLNGAQEKGASRMLYTLRPDGTALESFRCDHNGSSWQSDAVELDDKTLVFLGRSSDGAAAGGELMHIVQGSATATSLGKNGAVYESPRGFSGKELLVSKATMVPAGAGPKFDLYVVNTKTGALGERIFADAQLSSIEAVPVAPHEVPKRFWSTLNPESGTGYFISLNSYLSAEAPGGHFAKPITSVRVLMDAADGQERSLGEAPVENDGSFYVEVPANAPVRFVLLDATGQVIREERSWVWTRPGEQRGCTGCHGDRNVAPENHWPMTLKRFDTPIALGENAHAPATSAAK